MRERDIQELGKSVEMEALKWRMGILLCITPLCPQLLYKYHKYRIIVYAVAFEVSLTSSTAAGMAGHGFLIAS
jgi:hypothetical protein